MDSGRGSPRDAVADLAAALFDLLRAERTAIQIGVLGQKYAKCVGCTLKQALADAQWDMSVGQLLRSRPDLFEFATSDSSCTLVRARPVQDDTSHSLPTVSVALPSTTRRKLGGMEFYRSIGSPQNVVAPMVDQSEQAYRLLCRRYGAQLCYTPMFHSRLFAESARYRQEAWLQPPPGAPEDRPLIVQFCGNDPQTLLRAGRMVQDHCDAVDLNLGCPQGIARRGRYGAFLLTETELLREIVSTLHAGLDVPVTCKIRLLPRFEDTLKLVETLVDAGCQLLTVHGRTKEMNKQAVRETDWDAIRRIREFIDGRIPVFANGSIASREDVQRCIAVTGVNGVMTSEAILEHPALFAGGRQVSARGARQDAGETPGELRPGSDDGMEYGGAHEFVTQDQLAREYLELCRSHPPTSLKTVRSHLYKFLYTPMQHFPDQRAALGQAESMEEFEAIVNFFAEQRKAESQALAGGGVTSEVKSASTAPDAGHSVKVRWALEGQCGVHSWYGRHRAAQAKAARRAEEDAEAAAVTEGAGADTSMFAAIDDGSIGNLLAADY